ncbi:MAG: hypothetical protein JRN16_06250 [Nitrososphaerota archaeon]|nr:hypothetical protein [Nitrososphaerota archaeon]MDG7027992.1 hypothetical protein [Nitrososphaerota archaeon]
MARHSADQTNAKSLRGLKIATAGFVLLGVGTMLLPWASVLYILAGVFVIPSGFILASAGLWVFRSDYATTSPGRHAMMPVGLAVSLIGWLYSLSPDANYPIRDSLLLIGFLLLAWGYVSFRADYRRKMHPRQVGLDSFLIGLSVVLVAFLVFAAGQFDAVFELHDPIAAVVTSLVGLGWLFVALGTQQLKRGFSKSPDAFK